MTAIAGEIKFKVYRNGALIVEGLSAEEADALIAERRADDEEYGPRWGYSVGQYHKVKVHSGKRLR